jgi:hypothetical protein
MLNLRFQEPERALSLRPIPIGVGLYVVQEAIRGVVPPKEWEYEEHRRWFAAFLRRLHQRFAAKLTDEQRQLVKELSGYSIEQLYSFYLDPQVLFHSERYVPNPERNAVTYLRRAYGQGAVIEICDAVKEQTLNDPQETICYSVGGALRYLQAIW